MSSAHASDPGDIVVVEGKDSDLHKQFVAGKLIVGRKRIEESGGKTVEEVLRKEPSVTISSNGRLGLLGLPGYTQILVDGAPGSTGRSPLELDVVHIERIEIVKTSIAELGPYGTAGTINIITRKIARLSLTQARLGGALGARDHAGNFSWSSNHPGTFFSYSLQASGGYQRRSSDSETSVLRDAGDALPLQQQTANSRNTTDTPRLSTSSSLSWAIAKGEKIELSPSILWFKTTSNVDEYSAWAAQYQPGRPTHSESQSDQDLSTISIPLKWSYRPDKDTQLSLRLLSTQSRVASLLDRRDQIPAQSDEFRQSNQWMRMHNNSLKFDFSQGISASHELKAGLTLLNNRTWTDLANLRDKEFESSFDTFGRAREAIQRTRSYFLQDEWKISEEVSTNFGISGELRTTNMAEGEFVSASRYSVAAPSAHLAWKIDGSDRKQVRASVARSFKAPFLDQMVVRPVINPMAACPSKNECLTNAPEYADTAGNAQLKPEKALGFNLSYEHYFGKETSLTIELFERRITELVVNRIEYASVPWSRARRYVQRPSNDGDARLQGLSLEGVLNAREILAESPKIEMRGGVTFARSHRTDLAGADNHIPDQLPWRAKLGITYDMESAPLQFGINANWEPSERIQISDLRKSIIDRNFELGTEASWKIDQKYRLRFALENIGKARRRQADQYFETSSVVSKETVRHTAPKLGITLDIKL
ncbi:TonB-dependent receptor plug domain-containing protein [Rugamonas aquatica]|uniref:TonB-dependent receptor n=1 Tax=Rugamonas aquatica TaxID=2743357 RepID=A0A6A7N9D0_9BURK|nr:TonB-dependent receptor [Rugamonas aquatica]MQA41498.1 TonB-dependent receptor [Rugamonas aquatica]